MTDLTAALAQAKTGPLGLSDDHEARAADEEREIEAMARAAARAAGRLFVFDFREPESEDNYEVQQAYRDEATAARAALDTVRAGAPDDPDAEAWRLAERRAIAERDDFRRELHAIIDEVRAWAADDSGQAVVGALLLICDAHDPRRTR